MSALDITLAIAHGVVGLYLIFLTIADYRRIMRVNQRYRYIPRSSMSPIPLRLGDMFSLTPVRAVVIVQVVLTLFAIGMMALNDFISFGLLLIGALGYTITLRNHLEQ